MRLWILRATAAVVLGVALAAASFAADPPAPAPAMPAPAYQPLPVGVPVPDYDPYRAASPYNPIRIDRPVPDPSLNRPNMTLCCDIPNQNLGAYSGGCGRSFLRGHRCGGGCADGGCFGCSTLGHEAKFIFGSCRQFYGER